MQGMKGQEGKIRIIFVFLPLTTYKHLEIVVSPTRQANRWQTEDDASRRADRLHSQHT